jgi:cytochrome P450
MSAAGVKELADEFVYDPFAPIARADPYPIYAELRQRHPVYRVPGRELWVLSRFDDVQAAARDWKSLSNAEGVDLGGFAGLFGKGDFLDSDPPGHDRLRNVLRHRFAPRRIGELEAAIQGHVKTLLAPILEAGQGDLAADFAWKLPVRMITTLLGLPIEDSPWLLEQAQSFLERPAEQDRPTDEAVAAVRTMRGYFDEAATHPQGKSTFLHDMLEAEGRDDLSREELRGMCLLLFIAGMETTAGLLSSALLLLAQHEDQRDLLRQDPGLIPDAIEECLRVESPIQGMTRVATQGVDFHGEPIPLGDRVLLLYAAANRDENRWPSAERFDIRRERKRHLAFGEGIHHCLGAPLARLEARVALAACLRAMPEYVVSGPVRPVDTHHTRGLLEIPVDVNR